ncbi:SurA N-terminal domain-containing protein [Celeribacter marinus]|uniref:Peptidyl-prolyl cis-trans isomerase PpiD n=1 Tax=Celeribacter marinus TaxID=1397108 RepID=A0A0P0ABG2_9RHOB|nr:SurA N-terminal domain-containing protein [Celeribacter marinus]ALI56095.1 peptidyl-prolyl cis-trans isomerase PpiD [Celeribacter marinus]SFK93909.1 peptidyl-prolyl cis-trans isomerase D [Celeribacter marinus]
MASGKGSGGKVIAMGIVGLLILGLGGFGATNFGGTVRSVGAVGDQEVDLNVYARALQNELSALEQQTGQQITVAQATQLGVTNQVLDGLLTRAALDGELARLGVSVGDDEVRRTLMSISAFQGVDGTFDADTYKFAIERLGQTTNEFEASLRSDTARALLQGALATGVVMPDAYAKVIVDWLGERRTVSVASLTSVDLDTQVEQATDAQITAQYEENPAAYTAPETRDVTYAWLSPTMISDTVELDEASLRQIYDDNIAAYIQPERRLVERLVYGSDADAQAAADRIAAGETTFDDEVTARGLSLADIDLGDVAPSDIGAAADAVFGAQELGLVGPVMSDLGPALFRVNGVLEASEIAFEDARDDLAKEMATDAARREIGDLVETLDDLLASGATLEELTAETAMELGQIDWSTASEDGLASYATFVTTVQAAQVGDFPEIIELSDGGIFALRLNAINPAAVRPLDEVRDQVAADWTASETARLLNARAIDIQTEVAAGTAMDALGLPVETFADITRRDFISTMPQGFIDAVFAPGLALGATTVITGADRVVIARVDAVQPPDANTEMDEIAASYAEQAAQGAAQDVIAAFANAMRVRDGVTVNQAAINAVHAQMP